MEVNRMNHSTTKRFDKLFFWIGIAVIILFWFILTIVNDNIFFPNISDVLMDVFKLIIDPNNLLIILFTLLKLIGLVIIGFLISLVFAILAYYFSAFRSAISPLIAIMRSTPVAALIIILILLIGSKLTPIFITLFVIIPLAYENIYSAFVGINQELIDETKLISNINLNVIFKIFIPVTINYLLSSVLSCLGLALKVLVMSEVLTQGNNTIGGSIQLAKATLDITRVFSWSIILVLIVLIIEYIIKKVNMKISK